MSPLLFSSPARADTVSVSAWENNDLSVIMTNGSYFDKVVFAFYGSPDHTCGADVTQIVAPYFEGLSSGSVPASNGIFGDPCPGTYKVLEIELSFITTVIIDPTPEPTPTPTIEPTPEPTITPTPTPTPTPTKTPRPRPTYTPTPEPTSEPTPSPTPTQTETPTPTPTPTVEPTSTPTPTNIPTPEPAPIPTKTGEPTPIPIITPSILPSPLPAPQPSIDPIPDTTNQILPYTEADKVTEKQASEVLTTISNPIAIANAVGESLQQTVEFVGKLFTDPGATISAVVDNVSKAGLDMTNDQRQKAHEVIIPVVIVSSIVSTVIGRIK